MQKRALKFDQQGTRELMIAIWLIFTHYEQYSLNTVIVVYFIEVIFQPLVVMEKQKNVAENSLFFNLRDNPCLSTKSTLSMLYKLFSWIYLIFYLYVLHAILLND